MTKLDGVYVSFSLDRKVFIHSLRISSIYPCMRVSIIPFCSKIQYIFFQSISFAPSPWAFFASELTHCHFAGVLFIDITTLLHYLKNLTPTETSSRSCDPLSRPSMTSTLPLSLDRFEKTQSKSQCLWLRENFAGYMRPPTRAVSMGS